MTCVSTIRSKIYDRFNSSQKHKNKYYGFSSEDDYAAYYTAMYLIDDAHLALSEHRSKGFSRSSGLAYLELWGVLQTVIIQQDAIMELYRALTGEKPNKVMLGGSWKEIRDLRNEISGHPISSGYGKSRSFLGRGFGNYHYIQYERYNVSGQATELGMPISSPEIHLGALLDCYYRHATIVLYCAYRQMRKTW